MKLKIISIIVLLCAFGCADQSKRQRTLEAMYPYCKIEPSTGLIQQNGYEFIAIDTTGQIVAVSFYPWAGSRDDC